MPGDSSCEIQTRSQRGDCHRYDYNRANLHEIFAKQRGLGVEQYVDAYPLILRLIEAEHHADGRMRERLGKPAAGTT